jgi:thymidylate synthase ThyX
MKVTCVGIDSTAQQTVKLTPEMLAATGARYSRNNEGLEAILSKVEGMDPDKAVDSIFKMVDYGHRSITDMAPVAMFIDDVSLWMALRLWQWSPTAGGQESSTRYVKLKLENIVKPPKADSDYNDLMAEAFAAYETAYEIWSEAAEVDPSLMNLPDEIKKGDKALPRMRRNFAFDRARYFLPMSCQTNVMLEMSARGWVDLIKMLWSDYNAESVELAELMTENLGLATPRLTRHARPDESFSSGLAKELETVRKTAYEQTPLSVSMLHSAGAYCEITPPKMKENDLQAAIVGDLEDHNGRYDYFGPTIRRTAVRFGWAALTIAELRDLNRHRTGTKTFDLTPVGCYFADDQVSKLSLSNPDAAKDLDGLRECGERLVARALKMAQKGDPSYVYYLPLGAQCAYEHITTADKFLYQCELRTGLGAHYTYAARMREVLACWHGRFPATKTMIVPGTAEPE